MLLCKRNSKFHQLSIWDSVSQLLKSPVRVSLNYVPVLTRRFIKGRAPGKLTGCERELAINLLGCFRLLFLLSFVSKTKNTWLKNPTDLLLKNLMKPLINCYQDIQTFVLLPLTIVCFLIFFSFSGNYSLFVRASPLLLQALFSASKQVHAIMNTKMI